MKTLTKSAFVQRRDKFDRDKTKSLIDKGQVDLIVLGRRRIKEKRFDRIDT